MTHDNLTLSDKDLYTIVSKHSYQILSSNCQFQWSLHDLAEINQGVAHRHAIDYTEKGGKSYKRRINFQKGQLYKFDRPGGVA